MEFTKQSGVWEETLNETKTIGTTAVLLSTARQRKTYAFRNISAGGQVITLSFNKTAVANNGITLNVNDVYMDSEQAGYTPFQGDISAIASAAGAVITISER